MIVIINGPPGVGKTTVSKAIAKLRPGTICIHGDHLRAFAPADPRQHLGGGSTYRAGAALAREYLKMGAPLVLFDYCFLRPRHLAYFDEQLRGDIPTKMFTLWATLATVRGRERGRPDRSPLGEAVDECYAEMAGCLGELGRTVDAEADSPDVIAGKILARL